MPKILFNQQIADDTITVDQADNGAHSIYVNGTITVFGLSASVAITELDEQIKFAYARQQERNAK